VVLVAGAVPAAAQVEAQAVAPAAAQVEAQAVAPTEALAVEARVAVLTEAEARVHPAQAAAVLPEAGITKDRCRRITDNPKATFRSACEVGF
jgi:hypothetical protein